MTECKFCDEEFENEEDMHIHWREEHEEELNSHQEEKVKKAERKKQEEEKSRMAGRKKLAGQLLAGGAALVLVAVLATQLLSSPERTSGATFDLDGQPMMGSEDANVTVVEFGDYKCPYCRQFEQQTFSQLREDYIDTGQVSFYFVNYAFLNLPDGQSSTRAAVASECVYEQNEKQFWNFHKSLYENQGPEREDWATVDKLMQIARDSTEGLNYEELQSCVQGMETRGQVNADKSMGDQNGVTGTPAVFVNGNEVGNRYSSIKAAVEQQLQ